MCTCLNKHSFYLGEILHSSYPPSVCLWAFGLDPARMLIFLLHSFQPGLCPSFLFSFINAVCLTAAFPVLHLSSNLFSSFLRRLESSNELQQNQATEKPANTSSADRTRNNSRSTVEHTKTDKLKSIMQMLS